LNDRTILVVDDEPSVLEFVGKLLRRSGYNVVALSRAQDALVWLREHPGGAHLLVSDVVMPGMSGLDLVAELRTTHPDLPALLISGYPDRVPRTVAEPLAPLLQKPFTPVQLLDEVRRLLGD
jgi:DNA-binding NtrC family response regulator